MSRHTGDADPDRAPIDWARAAATARKLVRPGPTISVDEAGEVVSRLREHAVTAERHVREVTGLGIGLPVRQGDVVDRAGWVDAAVSGLAALTNGALPAAALSGSMRRLTAGAAGVQAGVAIAYLGGRVLGQYDPFGGADHTGRLLLVAPNVVAVQRALDVPAEDFRLWVCLHESTHRLQFTAVPWLRDHFAGLVAELLAATEASASTLLERLPEALRAARRRSVAGAADRGRSLTGGPGPLGLLELIQAPEQRAALDRLLALATLLEGHADYVMDSVGPAVVPSVATIRQRFTERRKGGGLADRLLRALLGVEAKVRQYAEGARFTRHVVDAVGMAGFNAVWTSPETLPTRAEVAEPDEWLRRIHPS